MAECDQLRTVKLNNKITLFERRVGMADKTINFPKLKNASNTTSLHSFAGTLKTIPIFQPQGMSRLPSYKDKLVQRKYLYINKSPEYFKRRQNSQYYIKPHKQIDGSLEDLSEQMQKYDRKARDRVHPALSKLLQSSKQQKPRQSKQKSNFEQIPQSNYDKFRAPSIAMRHMFSRGV